MRPETAAVGRRRKSQQSSDRRKSVVSKNRVSTVEQSKSAIAGLNGGPLIRTSVEDGSVVLQAGKHPCAVSRVWPNTLYLNSIEARIERSEGPSSIIEGISAAVIAQVSAICERIIRSRVLVAVRPAVGRQEVPRSSRVAAVVWSNASERHVTRVGGVDDQKLIVR